MESKEWTFVLISIFILIEVKCEDSLNNTTNSTDISVDNSLDFEEINDQNKLMLNLNHNCSTHDDCNAKHSVCDSTYNTCECDITSMQTLLKCRTVFCESNEECMLRFPYTSCTLGRCQCMSGRKFKGRCIRTMGMYNSNPLPDWAIISIAATLALSVLAGGTLKKRELRQQLIKIISFFFQRNENQQNCNTSNDIHNINSNDSLNSENKSNLNKIIEP